MAELICNIKFVETMTGRCLSVDIFNIMYFFHMSENKEEINLILTIIISNKHNTHTNPQKSTVNIH